MCALQWETQQMVALSHFPETRQGSSPVPGWALVGIEIPHSWLDITAISKCYHGDHLCSITNPSHNSSI